MSENSNTNPVETIARLNVRAVEIAKQALPHLAELQALLAEYQQNDQQINSLRTLEHVNAGNLYGIARLETTYIAQNIADLRNFEKMANDPKGQTK